MVNKKIDLFSVRKISLICSFASASIALFAILGWHFNIEVLKRLSPDFISMKFNTAICILLFSLAHITLTVKPSSSYWRWLAHSFTGMATLIAGLTALQYIFKIDFGIDQLAYQEVSSDALNYPGRWAPVTGASFLLLSLAYSFIYFTSRPYYRTSQCFLLITSLICFQGLVAYSLGIQTSFGLGLHTRIAIHTALGIGLLVAAFLLLTAHHGYMKIMMRSTYIGRNAWSLIAAAIFIPPTLSYLDRLGQNTGLFDADFGTLFKTVASVAFFVILIWRNTIFQ